MTSITDRSQTISEVVIEPYRIVVRTDLDWAVVLEVYDAVRTGEGAVIPPDEVPSTLESLTGRSVDKMAVDHPGTLSLTLDDRSRIDIGCDPSGRYEAWSVVAPDGVRAVAMPDGEVAFWDPPPVQQ
ncbi:DUF6188 family protein [Gordonia hankookensis]|uniref:Uncharacterized protein n=1 Tax=Gordonia hankookensis TaxID=589403 RepID=A0ABR7WD27_9ACTN|nr:DUF6188 family protein [Gordonia hankookensis]MBD1320693.1 hypothetical protein [Gordonia hankookensis]